MAAANDNSDVHLVRVTTDDRTHQIWVSAGRREEAISQVLNAIPEGWAAALLSDRLGPREAEVLNLRPGDVREITSLRS